MKHIAVAGFCLVLTVVSIVSGAADAGEAVAAVPTPAVSEADAGKIALSYLENGRIIRSEMRYKRDGRSRYEFVVVNDVDRVEVEIDGADGRVLELERKRINRTATPSPQSSGGAPGSAVSIDRAREIALARSGGGDVVKLEMEYKKNGRTLYEIEIINNGIEYEMEIDGETGAILEYKEDRD